jgi:hypothetical protein
MVGPRPGLFRPECKDGFQRLCFRGHMFAMSVRMAGGGGLSWPVAKPDVCWVRHSYGQLHPVTRKVSKVLWGGRRLASYLFTLPLGAPFLAHDFPSITGSPPARCSLSCPPAFPTHQGLPGYWFHFPSLLGRMSQAPLHLSST